MTAVPHFLRDLHPGLAQAILTAYVEDGIHPTSLTVEHVERLIDEGYLVQDIWGYLVVTPEVKEKFELVRRM